MSRHGRQIRLAEMGSAGQTRIAATNADVLATGLAAEVATRYLAGAGVGCVRVRDGALAAVVASVDPTVRVEVTAPSTVMSALASAHASKDGGELPWLVEKDAAFFRNPGPRQVALGALEALRVLRAAIGGVS